MSEKQQYTPAEDIAAELNAAAHTIRYRREDVNRQLANIVDAMERKMDDIKRNVEYFKSGTYDAIHTVHYVQHDLLWMVANFGLDNLTTSAAEHDTAKAEFDRCQKLAEQVTDEDRTETFCRLYSRAWESFNN